jgi:hypothetical protein
MKTGKTLVEMAMELQRVSAAKKDFIVPVEKMTMIVEKVGGADTAALTFKNGKDHVFAPTNWAHSQIAGYTDIPKAYYDRLAGEKPGLLADNVNHGFAKAASVTDRSGRRDSRMIRTLDDKVRGFLSSRYRQLDAHDLAETVLPTIMQNGMTVVSSELTERRFFLKVLSPRITAEVKPGDTVQHGLVISSSDVGAGSVRVEPLVYRLLCSNGMIGDTAMRKFHVGKNQGEDNVRELLTDETLALTDAAFWASVRDVVLASMKPENFERQVDRLRIAANTPILNFDLPRVVELTMKATGITGEGKANSILAALASGNEGAGLTQWGLINSFTRAAYDKALNYEDSIDMERAAGKILELPKSQWQTIAAVA